MTRKMPDLIPLDAAKEAVEKALVRCKHDNGTGMMPACKTQRHFAALAIAALDAIPAAEGEPDDLADAVMLLMRCVRRLQADDPVGSKALDWLERRNLKPGVLRANEGVPS